jgi:hypothetical protein
MKHIVNDVKVLQNIRRTCTVALSITSRCNLGSTRLRHQIPKHLIQTIKISFKCSSNGFHGSGRWFCMYPRPPTPPLPCWRLQGPPHLLAGSQEEWLTLTASKISVEPSNVKWMGGVGSNGPGQPKYSLHHMCMHWHAVCYPTSYSFFCAYRDSWLSTSALLCLPMICWKRGSACDAEPYKAVKPHLR